MYQLGIELYEDYKAQQVQWVELSKLAQHRDGMIEQDKHNTFGNKKIIEDKITYSLKKEKIHFQAVFF